MGKRTPPTSHEIRSLSTRLYEEQSDEVNTQALLGHTDPETTEIYKDGRGTWVKVSFGKPIPRQRNRSARDHEGPLRGPSFWILYMGETRENLGERSIFPD
jgi:hypothetical protein